MLDDSSEESSLGNEGDFGSSSIAFFQCSNFYCHILDEDRRDWSTSLSSTALPKSTTKKLSGKATRKKQKRGALSFLVYNSYSMQYI